MQRKSIFIFSLLIALFTFLIYLPAINYGFVDWDDGSYVFRNTQIRSININFFKALFTDHFNYWHPLTILSYAFDYAIWGQNPSGYHLTNVLLHTANTLIVFSLSYRLVLCLKHYKGSIEQLALIAALITATFFGIHPINVETVAWVSGRKDVLCTLFFLISIFFYLRFTDLTPQRQIYYTLSIFSFALSLMSKPMAVSLPLVLLLIDAFPLNRFSDKSGWASCKLLVEKLPYILLSIISFWATMSAYNAGNSLKSLDAVPFLLRVFLSADAYIFYFLKSLFPFSLGPDYLRPTRVYIFDLKYSGALITILLFTILSIWKRRSHRLLSTIWFFYFITLLPIIGIIQGKTPGLADRYAYLPGIGIIFLFGLTVAHILLMSPEKKRRASICSTLVLMIFILSFQTKRQMTFWQDTVALWSRHIKIFPNNPDAYNERGFAFHQGGSLRMAIADYNKAIRLSPRFAKAYNNRAIAYKKLGFIKESARDFQIARTLSPQLAAPNNFHDNKFPHK